MSSRLKLDDLLKNIIGPDRLYYQPPESVRLHYPCIIYEKTRMDANHADDRPYAVTNVYTVKVIYTDPDSTLPGKIANLPTAQHVTNYTSDNLYHDVFTMYV